MERIKSIDIEHIKSNVSEIVKHLKDDVDDVEMLDTNGVVLKFSKDVDETTVEWLCDIIKKPVSFGGANMTIEKYEVNDDENRTSAFILTASLTQFIRAAEEFQLLKKTHDGKFKPFTQKTCMDFENYEEDNESFLSCAEKQYLLKKMLDHVVCKDDSIKNVVGQENIKLHEGKPILPACVAKEILQIYPLHDYDHLKLLQRKWYTVFSTISDWTLPIEEIKDYFGEKIALYFFFLNFYTKYLIPPAVIGLCHFLFVVDENKADNVWFALLNLFWATIFLELWKRKRCSLIFDWGRLTSMKETSVLLEKTRAGHRGIQRISPITGQTEIYQPSWERQMKFLVTYPAVILSIVLSIITTQLYLLIEQKLDDTLSDYNNIFVTMLTTIPTILYALLIFKVNSIYGQIAVNLNDWENHRIQSSYDNHLIIKLTLFYFINSFMSSFYIAFYVQDMALLRQHLATLLITKQLVQQVTESLIPYLLFKSSNVQVEKDGKKIRLKKLKDPKNQVTREGNLQKYDGAFGDYLEMLLQFGYVFLFSAVYPLAAFWALLNNIVEMKSDAFKLCRLHQRPFREPASSTGAWESVFECMTILAVITNCGVIALSPSIKQWMSADTHPGTYIITFVALEHILVILKFALQKVIPDVPGRIRKEFAKMEYQANLESQNKRNVHSNEINL